MGLTANGLGSGLDINGIVSALVNAEKAPKEAQFNVQEGKLNTQISALGALKSAISEFTDKLKPLSDPNTFNGFTSKLSSSDFLKVKTTSDAVAGSYNISVKQLAQSQKLGSAAVADADAAIGAGTLSFSVNGESFDIEVGAEDSLKDIVKKINGSDSNVGVTATIVNGDAGPQLVLTSDKTGEDNTITVTASADSSSALADTFTMTELQPPKNAIVTVDGVTITSKSNEIENAISGVNLTLTAADVDKTTTLTISPNTDGAKKAVTEFVDAYNSLMKTVQNMSGYDPETKKAGAFQGDALIRGLQNQFRSVMSSSFGSEDGQMMLANLGIKTTREGLLEIDDDKLTQALKDKPEQISEFFANKDTGLVAKLTEVSENYVQTGGIIDSRDESLDKQLSRIGDSRKQLAIKMAAYESRLFAQYNAMDLLVGQLNAQSSMLQQKFDSLPGLVSKK